MSLVCKWTTPQTHLHNSLKTDQVPFSVFFYIHLLLPCDRTHLGGVVGEIVEEDETTAHSVYLNSISTVPCIKILLLSLQYPFPLSLSNLYTTLSPSSSPWLNMDQSLTSLQVAYWPQSKLKPPTYYRWLVSVKRDKVVMLFNYNFTNTSAAHNVNTF